MGEDTPLSWKRALYILSRLPPEIRREVYRYTLVTSRFIWLPGYAGRRRVYEWRESSDVLTRQLNQASDFYTWAAPTIQQDEVDDYVLSHNTVDILNKNTADRLVKMVEDLSQAGFTAMVHRLVVDVSGDRVTEADGHEGFRMLPNSNDYKDCDPAHLAFGTYRYLKPLTKLHRLRSLEIKLKEAAFGTSSFFHIPPDNGYEVVYSVISQLQDLVLASSKTPEFKVCHLVALCTKYAEVINITKMWGPLSNKKREKLPQKFKGFAFHALEINAKLTDDDWICDCC